ncbi:hypothetical protein GF338_01430 [candidate division WOR-3 bacterium]|nr:hypothetical protein [candidate division WOR-3 bacterium]
MNVGDIYGSWAEVKKCRPIKLSGNQGVRLEIAISYEDDLPDMIVQQRLYIADNRFYILSTSYPADMKKRGNVRKFFRSFRLLE